MLAEAAVASSASAPGSPERDLGAGAADAAEVATESSRDLEPRGESHEGGAELSHTAQGRHQQALLSGVAALMSSDARPSGPAMTVERAYPAGKQYGHVAEVAFAEPMTKEQVAGYFYRDGKLPKGTVLESMDAFMGLPGRKWRFFLPNVNTGTSHMRPEAFDALLGHTSDKFQKFPPWTPRRTAELLAQGRPPQAGDPQLDLVKTSGSVTVWKEGDSLFWFDDKARRYEGIKLSDLPVMRTYNKDLVHYVTEEFVAPNAAVDKFVKQWSHINFMIMGAFGYALSSTLGTNTGGAPSPASFDDVVVDRAREER